MNACCDSLKWFVALYVIVTRQITRDDGSLKIKNVSVTMKGTRLYPVTSCTKLNGNHDWVIICPFTTTSVKVSLRKAVNHSPSEAPQWLTIDYSGCTWQLKLPAVRAAVTKCDPNWELLTFCNCKMSTFQELRTGLFFDLYWPHICDVSSGFLRGYSVFSPIKLYGTLLKLNIEVVLSCTVVTIIHTLDKLILLKRKSFGCISAH